MNNEKEKPIFFCLQHDLIFDFLWLMTWHTFRKCIAEKKRFVRWMVCISIPCIMHALKHSIAFAKANIRKRLAYRRLRVSSM